MATTTATTTIDMQSTAKLDLVDSPRRPLVARSKSAADTPDTNKLRLALRLVHCIQKERGSSCAYYANHTVFESAMHQARVASDICAKYMRPHTDLPISSSLEKIRSLVESHNHSLQTTNDLIFHRIFVCFNTLIASVVQECVLKNLSGDVSIRSECIRDGGDKDNINAPPKRENHVRHLSSDINDHLTSNSWTTMIATLEKRNTCPKAFAFNDGEQHTSAVPNKNHPISVPILPPNDNVMGNNINGLINVMDLPEACQDVQQLLDLLRLFVQLKESAGVERAILSSLLAFRNCLPKDDSSDEEEPDSGFKDLPSFRMLTNDLILEVENQRALYAKLEMLPSGPHHSLVLELAELSPRLKDLQQIILTDFDSLKGAEFDSEAIWNMITLYIDKLHSVELLIIEDLDIACADVRNISNSHLTATPSQQKHGVQNLSVKKVVDRALEQLERVGDSSVSHELVADIKRMSAEELKYRLLGLLTAETQSDVSGLVRKNESRSVSVYAESSAAQILKQDMNNALHKQLERVPSKEWEISIYEIKFTKRLGQGASATTYLGKWTGQNVAVKVASITEFGLEGWRTEVNALQRLHHPNIIRLMGSVYNENPQTHCLVLEYCNAGDLATALRYPTPRNFFFHVSSSIANAMAYLHQRGIMHRDLKPSNILCDGNVASGNFIVKITDFGIATDISRINDPNGSQAKEGNRKKLTGETGTYRWMSPEVIRHEHYSTTADVFSFAVMMWQFVTREEPFSEVSSVEAANLVAVEKKRMAMPAGTPGPLVELIEKNWDDDPAKRSWFHDIAKSINQLQETLPRTDIEWLEEPHGHPLMGETGFDEGLDARFQEVFKSQPLAAGLQQHNEKSSSLGKKMRRGYESQRGKAPNERGKSPSGRKPSLLSSFFKKTSFEH